MGLMQVVKPDADRNIRLPKEFIDQLNIHAGEKLVIRLVEGADLILVFPSRRLRRSHLPDSEMPTARQRVQQALANAGLLATLDPTTIERYASRAERPRLSPLKVGGKPASEIIVEERNRW